MDVLKQEKEACVLKSEEVRQYLGAVITVAEHIFRERDRLLSTVCTDTPDTRTAVLTHQISRTAVYEDSVQILFVKL